MKRSWKPIKNRPLRFAVISSFLLLAFASGSKILIGIGAIFIVGTGDGVPPAEMKALGAFALLITALIALVILGNL
jgi:hypothetical protein